MIRHDGERRIKISDLKPGGKPPSRMTAKSPASTPTRSSARRAWWGGASRESGSARGGQGRNRRPSSSMRERRSRLAGEAVALADLRVGDTVDIKHDSPGPQNSPRPSSSPRGGPQKRTVSRSLSAYRTATISAGTWKTRPPTPRHIKETLVKRYRVPDNQAVLLVDPTKEVLKQNISESVGAGRGRQPGRRLFCRPRMAGRGRRLFGD